MIRKICFTFFLIFCLLGCGQTNKAQDISVVKDLIKENDYQLSWNGKRDEFNIIVISRLFSDRPKEGINLIAIVDEDNKKVNSLEFICFENNEMFYNKSLNSYNVIGETVYPFSGQINNQAKEKAISFLERDNLSIVDIYNYVTYCLENDYYEEFRN